MRLLMFVVSMLLICPQIWAYEAAKSVDLNQSLLNQVTLAFDSIQIPVNSIWPGGFGDLDRYVIQDGYFLRFGKTPVAEFPVCVIRIKPGAAVNLRTLPNKIEVDLVRGPLFGEADNSLRQYSNFFMSDDDPIFHSVRCYGPGTALDRQPPVPTADDVSRAFGGRAKLLQSTSGADNPIAR